MTHLYRKFRERNSMGHDEPGIGTLVWEVARLRRPEPGSSGSGKQDLLAAAASEQTAGQCV
jgi:hypothetical protein